MHLLNLYNSVTNRMFHNYIMIYMREIGLSGIEDSLFCYMEDKRFGYNICHDVCYIQNDEIVD